MIESNQDLLGDDLPEIQPDCSFLCKHAFSVYGSYLVKVKVIDA
jgi:hypothetical protein